MLSEGQGHIIYLFYVPERPTKAEGSTGERGKEWQNKRWGKWGVCDWMESSQYRSFQSSVTVMTGK